MITISRTNQLDNSLELTDTIAEHCWIHMINPSDSEVEQVSRVTGITDVMLKSALDEEETADESADVTDYTDIPEFHSVFTAPEEPAAPEVPAIPAAAESAEPRAENPEEQEDDENADA